MSGFSAEWLSLREPADARARSSELFAAFVERVSKREELNFCDLGCGTGANLRAIALALPEGRLQRWRLVDHDASLLAAARKKLRAWADASEENGEILVLRCRGRVIEVAFQEADLNRDLDRVIQAGDIVAASALFDLCSKSFIESFARTAARLASPVYATLIYNGIEQWMPPHATDGPMLAAFNSHQLRDKGFGRACGPKAATVLTRSLSGLDYKVETGQSPWQLGEADRKLIAALAEGTASAVSELSVYDEAVIGSWRESRTQAISCLIGHADILAWPPA